MYSKNQKIQSFFFWDRVSLYSQGCPGTLSFRPGWPQSQKSTCISLPNAGITGMCHHCPEKLPSWCSQWDYDNLFNQKLTCWNGTFSTKSTPFSVGNKLKIPCFFLIHHAVHTPVHHNACRLTPWSSCCRSTSGLCINHVFLLCKLHMCHSRLPVNIMLDNWIALEQLDNSIALEQLVHYGLVYNNASIEVDMYAGLCVVNWDFFLKFKLLAVVVSWGKEY